MGVQDLAGVRDGTVRGRWSHVHPLEDSILPSAQDKEASQHTIFVKTEVSVLKDVFDMLRVLRSVFHLLIFPSGYGWFLPLSFCFHRWDEINHHLLENSLGGGSCEVGEQVLLIINLNQSTVKLNIWLCSSEGYNIEWATKTYPMSRLTPPCKPVRSRGALVPAFSPDGRLLAVVLNQRQPKVSVWLSSNSRVCHV